MKVYRPTSLDEALELLAADPAPTPIAGGTDLMVSWPSRPQSHHAMVDLSRLNGDMRQMHLEPERLTIGGGVTYWDVLRSTEIGQAFPLLHEAARQVGAVQIQTRGTWAGNIANGSPAADGVPVLMAYDAEVTLAGCDATITIPLDQYYTGYKESVRRPDQLITRIELPCRPRSVQWFCKVGARSAQAITKVGVTMVFDASGWHIVANSVAPTVRRCRALEAAMNAGQHFPDRSVIRALLDTDIAPIDDIRSNAAYRADVLARLIWHKWQDDNLQQFVTS
jgi:xanthine dehydrogenase small subunit